MRERRWYPVIYMFLVTAFFSFIVIGFTQLTNERVKANERLAFEKAVLSVLPGLYEKDLGRVELHNLFVRQVHEPDDSSGGAYTLKKERRIVAYALPISGQGFWAPIKGVIGIAADKKKVTGIAFYQQNETPGLGAEINKPAFTNQFKSKVLATEGKPLNMKRPGDMLGNSEVHAVTGATQTSNRLEKIINVELENWRATLTKPSR